MQFLSRACLTILTFVLLSAPALAEPVKTELRQTANGWQLIRDGQPYFIKGGGGDGPKDLLKQVGGNSFRTWGVGPETRTQLDNAEKLGLTVAVGYWLGHKEHGFKYDDAEKVRQQFEGAKRAVMTYKDHPAVLLWGIGNEMEMGMTGDAVWNAVEDIARMVKEVDPNHPTMTVIAELGRDSEHVKKIHTLCPHIDIVGINTYGSGSSVAERYRKAGGTKPYIITEFGPAGTWETPHNSFGAAIEQTSTKKADFYRNTYQHAVTDAPDLCLGSYVFTWGFKNEATATWFGLFLPDGSKLGAVDTMEELWSGKKSQNPCPVMNHLSLSGKDVVAAGETVTATVDVSDPSGKPVNIEWVLRAEMGSYAVQGAGTDRIPDYPEAIAENGKPTVTIKLPTTAGVYRIYCYARNSTGGAAVGSVAVKVVTSDTATKAPEAH